jgi:hypothetical protein
MKLVTASQHLMSMKYVTYFSVFAISPYCSLTTLKALPKNDSNLPVHSDAPEGGA